MGKLICTILCAVVCTNLYANELSLNYAETKTASIKGVSYQTTLDYQPLEYSTFSKYQETNDDYSLHLGADVNYGINPFDIFISGAYDTDTALLIKDQVDFTVGGGWEFYNDYTNRYKISYGLVFREDRVLNKYRLKYTRDGKLIYIKMVAWYIAPTEEIIFESGVGVKIFDLMALGIKHEYRSRKDYYDYITSVALKIKL